MKRIVWGFCLVGLFTALRAEEPVYADARAVYEDSLAKFMKRHEAKVDDLRERYVARLDRVQEQVQAAGDLDGVLQVRTEKTAVEAGEPLTPLDADAPEPLKQLRGHYENALAALERDLQTDIAGIRNPYIAFLERMEVKLTRENRIDDALACRAERMRLAEDAEAPAPAEAAVEPGEAPPLEEPELFVASWLPRPQPDTVEVRRGNRVERVKLELQQGNTLRPGGVNCDGGKLWVHGLNEALMEACRASNQLTLMIAFETDDLGQGGPARILSYSRDATQRNFTLGQEGDRLVLRLRTTETGPNGDNPALDLGELVLGKKNRVVFTYSPGTPRCYRDGKEIDVNPIGGDFSTWEEMHLLLGNETTGERPWTGQVGAFRISNRALDPETALRMSRTL